MVISHTTSKAGSLPGTAGGPYFFGFVVGFGLSDFRYS
jgi:hypothetical protein